MPIVNRRHVLRGLLGLAASSLQAQISKAGAGPLKITAVEPLIIRSPNRPASKEELMVMPPVGAMTGGPGLFNRLDFSTPSRSGPFTQAVLVKISTDQGLVGWGECHAPAAPRVHQTAISDMLAPAGPKRSAATRTTGRGNAREIAGSPDMGQIR